MKDLSTLIIVSKKDLKEFKEMDSSELEDLFFSLILRRQGIIEVYYQTQDLLLMKKVIGAKFFESFAFKEAEILELKKEYDSLIKELSSKFY